MDDRITTYQNDGLTFDVRDEGPLHGTPVVLLHGFPERSTSWRHVAPLLHAAGLRTFAPDQRGYSPGARPTRRRDYRLARLCGDVEALVDRSMTNRRVSVPTTMVWSDGDVAVARRGAEDTGRWVDAPYDLVVLEGVTHWIPTQAPDACAAAILDRLKVTA